MGVNTVGEVKGQASKRDTPLELRGYMPRVFLSQNYVDNQVNSPKWMGFDEALRTARHLKRVEAVGKAVMAKVIPEFFEDRQVRVTFEPGVDEERAEGAAYVNSSDLFAESGIIWRLSKKSDVGDMWRERVPAMGRFAGGEIGRGVRDVVWLVHEYSHMLVEKKVWNKNERLYKSVGSDLSMASRAIDEGVAILMERLAVNEIIKNYQQYGLTREDAEGARAFVEARHRALLDNRLRAESGDDEVKQGGERASCYNEGVEIVRQVFNRSGIGGVVEVLDRLDTSSVLVLRRSDPKWKEVVKQPMKLLGLSGNN